MAKIPATRLSLEYLRGRGMLAEVVERRIPMKPFPKTKDLFDFADIVAISPGYDHTYGCNQRGVFFVQTTSRTNKSARVKKMTEPEIAEKMITVQLAGRIELHCWAKDKRGRFEVDAYEVKVEYFLDRFHATVTPLVGPTMQETRDNRRDAGCGQKVTRKSKK